MCSKCWIMQLTPFPSRSFDVSLEAAILVCVPMTVDIYLPSVLHVLNLVYTVVNKSNLILTYILLAVSQCLSDKINRLPQQRSVSFSLNYFNCVCSMAGNLCRSDFYQIGIYKDIVMNMHK